MNTKTCVWIGFGFCCFFLLRTPQVDGTPVEAAVSPRTIASQIGSQEATPQKLTPYVRASLAELSTSNTNWTVMIASAPGKNAVVAQQVADRGGSVQYRLDSVGYVRARMPVTQIERLADLPEVEAMDIVSLRPQDELRFSHDSIWHIPFQPKVVPHSGSAETGRSDVRHITSSEIPPLDAHTPAINPYLPSRDIGAPQFIAGHPTFDGRGVTITAIEGVPYLLSPELLQPAATLEGRPIRKLVGIYAATGSGEDNGTSVPLEGEITARAGHFTFRNRTYTVPEDGTFRFGIYDARWIREAMTQGTTSLAGSGSLYAVLWNEKTNAVWVDTNQNQDFTDEKPLHDYNTTFEVGAFKTEKTATSPGEPIPFAVGTDTHTHEIDLYVGQSSHATNVGSVAVGKGFLHSAMNGVAPGAQIDFVLRGPRTYSILEAIICAMTLSKTDIVCFASRLSGGASGQNAFNRIVDRLVDVYHKPIFAIAGNDGPGLTSLSQAALPSRVICVGGYIHRDTFRANLGAVVRESDYVHNISSRGPGSDGGFKPDLLAPLCSLVAAQLYDPGNYRSHSLAGMYALPPGYSIVSGTSFSSPMAAGAAALLISAARQRGIPVDAERLRWALTSSARRLKGFQAYEQGSGLIDVPAAWKALQHAPDPVAIEIRAPVHTAFSKDLPLPDAGTGLYEREGWRVGMSAVRTIRLKRTSGSSAPRSYLLMWAGNDGTFHCASSIRLPLNTEVALPITIHPTAAGVHSVRLQFREPGSEQMAGEAMVTIVAAAQLTTEPGSRVEIQGRAEWQRKSAFYFNVPDVADALEIEVTLKQGANITFSLLGPDGQGHASTESSVMNGLHLTVPKPMPGVWEAIVENGTTHGTVDVRHSPPLPALITLRASVKIKGTPPMPSKK